MDSQQMLLLGVFYPIVVLNGIDTRVIYFFCILRYNKRHKGASSLGWIGKFVNAKE